MSDDEHTPQQPGENDWTERSVPIEGRSLVEWLMDTAANVSPSDVSERLREAAHALLRGEKERCQLFSIEKAVAQRIEALENENRQMAAALTSITLLSSAAKPSTHG